MLRHHLMLVSLPIHLLYTCRAYAQQCGLKGAAQSIAETEQGRWHCSPGAGSLHVLYRPMTLCRHLEIDSIQRPRDASLRF